LGYFPGESQRLKVYHHEIDLQVGEKRFNLFSRGH